MRILKIVVLKINRDIINNIIAWVTIGIFDKDGKQTMSFLISGKCFVAGYEIREGSELQFIPKELV